MSNNPIEEFITISKAEYDKLQGEKQGLSLSPSDLQIIIEHKEVFIRLIRVSQGLYRSNMWACRYKGKESEVYDWIQAFDQLIKNIDNASDAYKNYIDQSTQAGIQL